jgi:pyrimidine-specific ribonucleoside hydrolase
MEKKTEKIDVWLDCDPGHDDMMAIILGGFADNIHLIGMSTTAGNNSLEKTTENAIKTLEFAGIKGVDVVPGISEALIRGKMVVQDVFGDSGLDGANLPKPTQKPVDKNMFIHVYDVFSKNPKKITLVLTGPYTNFALFFKAFPEMKEKVEQIVVMGGAIHYGNVTPAAEFNIYSDAEAAKIILNLGIPVIMFPLDVTHRVLFNQETRKKFDNGSKFTETLGKLLTFFEEKSYDIDRLAGAPTHDPVTMAWLAKPEIFKLKDAFIQIECNSELTYGRTHVEFCEYTKKAKNAQIAVDVNPDMFWDLMVQCILKADKVSPLNVA